MKHYQHEKGTKTVASHDPLCGLPFDPISWANISLRSFLDATAAMCARRHVVMWVHMHTHL